ncbi:MAG: four helix bundle protein [Brevinematales bacterium]|nr:four helix bundle protein [Brevinematales bacterium]
MCVCGDGCFLKWEGCSVEKFSMSIKRFEEIKAWQLARDLTIAVYKLEFKTSYGYDLGLKDQIQRASVSIMSNIAEGFERGSDREFVKFLYIAKGSCGELRSLLHIAHDLLYISVEKHRELIFACEEVSKVIYGLIKYLMRKEGL